MKQNITKTLLSHHTWTHAPFHMIRNDGGKLQWHVGGIVLMCTYNIPNEELITYRPLIGHAP